METGIYPLKSKLIEVFADSYCVTVILLLRNIFVLIYLLQNSKYSDLVFTISFECLLPHYK